MAKSSSKMTNYILLPTSGMTAEDAPEVSDFLGTLSAHAMSVEPISFNRRSTKRNRGKLDMTVLDSIHENGAKLVEMNSENLAELRLSYPGVRVIPEVKYLPAWAPQMTVFEKAVGGSGGGIHVFVVDSKGDPVGQARVVLLTDFSNRIGNEGRTNSKGKVVVNISPRKKLERVYVYPEHSCWPLKMVDPKISGNQLTIKLSRIELDFIDGLKYFLKPSALPTLQDVVTVAVVDTGVDEHKDLPHLSGMNMIRNQPTTDFHDVAGHGTHVAGIIGATGMPPNGMRGIAAGVKIRSYRVFAAPKSGATNFDIMKAIDQAVTDGCDLINLSLGGTKQDPGVSSAIVAAYQRGVVCFAATGNAGRQPVCFPAAAQFSVAVSAMGKKITWPKNSTQSETPKKPFSTVDKNTFIASFSNIGPDVDMTAPGVGIISTIKRDKYAVMDGTSMACPAATGAAARLLATNNQVLTAARNASRSNDMMKLFSTHVKSMGFGSELEGKGLLKP